MNTAENLYSSLMNSFDAIGWVPTVRGSLSLSLFDISNPILGDVDKFSTQFDYYDNFVSSRYLVASSLFSTDDYKVSTVDKKYRRTFRYIFRGTVNDSERQKEFIDHINKQDVKEKLDDNFFESKTLLVGKLSIVSIPNQKNKNIPKELTSNEVKLLQSLAALKEKKKEYQNDFSIEAVSCEILKAHREDLKKLWIETETIIKNIETTENFGEPIYKFDVVLSRDGILFLKDDTGDYLVGKDKDDNVISLRDTYRKKGSANDFTENIPIHRLFKTAMNYIKFLFHKNYHHKDDDDNYLPATNLYPTKNAGKTRKIFKHQLEAFLQPITIAKRNGFSYPTCRPLGIIPYAKSFLYVCENNKFIEKEEADCLHKFLENQKSDIEISQLENNTIVGSFLTQRNLLATLTIAIAFLLATIQVFKFVSDVPEVNEWLKTINTWLVVLIVIFGGFSFGVVLKKIVEFNVFTEMLFKRKEKSNSIFNRDSKIDKKTGKGRLSRLYSLRLRLIDVKLKIKNIINRELIWGACLILIIALLMFFIKYLLSFFS